MKRTIIFLLLTYFFLLSSQNGEENPDSIQILWKAILQQKNYLDSLTTEYEDLLRKIEIQNKNSAETIHKAQNIQTDITKLLSGEKSIHSPFYSQPTILFIAVLPILMLVFFIIYLKYKHNKEMKTMNDTFHQYINDSKSLVHNMVNELEKTTEEAVDKAKSRIKILELIIAEAGQIIKPLNEKKKSIKLNQPLEPNSSHSANFGTNLINRYKQPITPSINKTTSSLQNPIRKPSPQSSSDRTSMILLLKKKGLSSAEIAKKLNMGIGEIELILNIYKKRNEL